MRLLKTLRAGGIAVFAAACMLGGSAAFVHSVHSVQSAQEISAGFADTSVQAAAPADQATGANSGSSEGDAQEVKLRHAAWTVETRPGSPPVAEYPVLPGTSAMQRVGDREYLLSVPAGYTGETPTPVLIVFHGWKETAQSMLQSNNLMSNEAIVIFAQGVQDAWAGAPYSATSFEQDAQYVQQVLTQVGKHYNLDPERFYAAGFSNGGAFAYSLACHAGAPIKAVVSVAGSMYPAMHQDCEGVAVPTMLMQGTSDPVISVDGGQRHGQTYASAWTVAQEAAQRAQCEQRVVESTEGTISAPAVARQFEGCVAPVRYVEVQGMQHSWSQEQGTSGYMWDFFKQNT